MTWVMRFALVGIVAAPLAAQRPAPRMMHHDMGPDMKQMEQMMAPMMGAMMYSPDHLLARKDSLGLTPQQVTRLTALRDAAKTTHDGAAADAKTHMDALAQAFQASAPDTTALRTHFQAAHDAMGKAHWTMLAAAAQARAVLSDEQRARIGAWMAAKEREHEHEDHH